MIKLTSNEKYHIEKELDVLKSRKRYEIAEALKEAREHGDLSENAEYDAAKGEQVEVENRIAKLEQILAEAEIVSSLTGKPKRICIGCRVKVFAYDIGKVENLEIVGSYETNSLNGRISDVSPVGSALIGAKIGSTIKAKTPSGILKFRVLEFEYSDKEPIAS